jgi:hypothetical protein
MSNVRLASKEDIAVMKLEAIAGRGDLRTLLIFIFYFNILH